MRDRQPVPAALEAIKMVEERRAKTCKCVVYLVNPWWPRDMSLDYGSAGSGDQENCWRFNLVRKPSECLSLFSFWLGKEGYDEG